MTELEEKLDELIAKRAPLLERLDAISKDIKKGLSPDFREQAVELENAEVLDEITRVTREELAKIEQAIIRIETAIARQH